MRAACENYFRTGGSSLTKMNHRMLVVKLHMDALSAQNTVGGIRRCLHGLPRDLQLAFEGTMKRIGLQSAQDSELAIRVLMWIVGATRLLEIDEVRCAAAITSESEPYFSEEDQPTLEVIMKVCAGLVYVESSAVRLARELLN
jgi:hypothetical protein